jgi:hypothetical protein
MTNGSHPHAKAGGKKAGTAAAAKRKPAAEVLTKGVKRKDPKGTKPPKG